MADCEYCAGSTITALPDTTVDPETIDPASRLPLFPDDTSLAHMANIEYLMNPEDVCIHSCYQNTKPEKREQLQLWDKCTYLYDGGWRHLSTFRDKGFFWSLLPAYCGSAFFNIKHKHLVIVHLGTEGILSVSADFLEVFLSSINGATKFAQTAVWFTNEVIKMYGCAARSVTVTGHSLGGWVAQASAFLCKYPKYQDENVITKLVRNNGGVRYNLGIEQVRGNPTTTQRIWTHLHCVCFDSPGFKETIINTIPNLGQLHSDRLHLHRHLDSLDVTIYLAEDFTVANFFNNQIGSVFVMQSVYVHSSDVIVKFWLDYVKASMKGPMRDVNPTDVDVLEVSEQETLRNVARTVCRNVLAFRANVFDEDELEIFKKIQYIKKSLDNNSGEWVGYFPNISDKF